MQLSDIHIRDPFVFPSPTEGLYYLFGTNCDGSWGPREKGFQYFTSPDLAEWAGPFPAFTPPANFWADRDFWAPEVHAYRGRFYLFGSLKAEGVRRGTQILAADRVGGPYVPLSAGPVTPAEWECLDGTLHVDDDGTPWMVFCHEWVQVGDGEICALPLTPALDAPAGEPVLLFTAAQALGVEPISVTGERQNIVTDGPFLHRAGNGDLLMLWSSFARGSYLQCVARSATGQLAGPWIHQEQPLFCDDGGHGMLFRAFDGTLVISLHRPNNYPDERALFLPVSDDGGILSVIRQEP